MVTFCPEATGSTMSKRTVAKEIDFSRPGGRLIPAPETAPPPPPTLGTLKPPFFPSSPRHSVPFEMATHGNVEVMFGGCPEMLKLGSLEIADAVAPRGTYRRRSGRTARENSSL